MTEDTRLILKELEKMHTNIEQITRQMDKQQEEVRSLRFLIEEYISKKINIIGEGHCEIKHMLNLALQMEKKRESMGLELINLRTDMNKVKDHLDIAQIMSGQN